jgi:uncharacterized membrane protein YkvA (DUF1232 family)
MDNQSAFHKLKILAKQLKSNLIVLYLSCKDQRVSWFARLFTIGVVAYAFSPIDLIPDFIPILGYVDDLIIVPLGIYLALKMIPKPVIDENRIKAQEMNSRPQNWLIAALFMLFWIALAVWLFLYIYGKLKLKL